MIGAALIALALSPYAIIIGAVLFWTALYFFLKWMPK